MDYYQNGNEPPYENGSSGYQNHNYYNSRPVKHPGSGFATAAMVLGIISIISAMFGTVFIPVVCGALAIIFGILSKGNDKVMLPNAKAGVVTAIIGQVVNIALIASVVILLLSDNTYLEQFTDQFNYMYESIYGESFEDYYGGYLEEF